MAFIMRLSANSNTCFAALFVALMLCVPTFAIAEGIQVARKEARITSSGQLLISSRFHTELPDQLTQALQQGVPLTFTLSYQLSAPTLAAYRFKFAQLVNTDNTLTYKLSYHPLTNRYRLSVGTFSTEYNSLKTALRGLGAVANWRVLDKGTLENTPAKNIRAEIRLSLSTAQLPKPFQINALTSKSWQLDSNWKPLTIKQK